TDSRAATSLMVTYSSVDTALPRLGWIDVGIGCTVSVAIPRRLRGISGFLGGAEVLITIRSAASVIRLGPTHLICRCIPYDISLHALLTADSVAHTVDAAPIECAALCQKHLTSACSSQCLQCAPGDCHATQA